MRVKNDGYVRFRCTGCGKKLKVKVTDEGGHIITCPRCRSSVNVPLVGPEAQRASVSLGNGEADLEAVADVAEEPAPMRAGNHRADLRRLGALDKFWSAVEQLDDDVLGWMQKLLRRPDLSEADVVREMRAIGERRASEIRDIALRHLKALREKQRAAERPLSVHSAAGSTAPAMKRREELRWSVVFLENCVRHVLRID
ncbi:MAG: hypothetical protein QGH74_09330 [Candidatus Brocadiia bacterium]|jgi:DNA-directed RNA polymerase subunit RPC12/RpoP|nr:hypothetical protein [Candidatus Brocadiia bacterium]